MLFRSISDGGLLVAVAEMALSGGIGAEIAAPADAPALHAWLFGEDQGRYLLAVKDAKPVLAAGHETGVPLHVLGTTGGQTLTVGGIGAISLAELKDIHEGWLPRYMATV